MTTITDLMSVSSHATYQSDKTASAKRIAALNAAFGEIIPKVILNLILEYQVSIPLSLCLDVRRFQYRPDDFYGASFSTDENGVTEVLTLQRVQKNGAPYTVVTINSLDEVTPTKEIKPNNMRLTGNNFTQMAWHREKFFLFFQFPLISELEEGSIKNDTLVPADISPYTEVNDDYRFVDDLFSFDPLSGIFFFKKHENGPIYYVHKESRDTLKQKQFNDKVLFARGWDGPRAVVVSTANAYFLDCVTNHETSLFSQPTTITAATMSPDRSSLFTADPGFAVSLYSLPSAARRERYVSSHTSPIVALSASTDSLVSVANNAYGTIHDISYNIETHQINFGYIPDNIRIVECALSKTGHFFGLKTFENNTSLNLTLWDLRAPTKPIKIED